MANGIWTIKRCLDWTREYLADKGDERPRVSAEWLLSHVTGLSRTQLYVSFDKPLAPEELSAMHEVVVRRAKGEPLQYITGETSFRAITVACAPGVLIPRPETEVLVEEVLEFLDREVLGACPCSARERVELPWNTEVEAALRAERTTADSASEVIAPTAGGVDPTAGEGRADAAIDPADAAAGAAEAGSSGAASYADEAASPVEVGDGSSLVGATDPESAAPRIARVLEVGCGTGCISLSLAHERAGRVTCVAIDIEPRAVALATRNRDALGLGADAVDIRLGNLVSPLDRETEWGTFDVLVSNPPYIPTDVIHGLPHEVADFEPALALDGGADGLDIFRRLVNAAPHMLRPGGLLACELYEGHLDEAAALCRCAGMREVCVVNDLANRPRIVLALV